MFSLSFRFGSRFGEDARVKRCNVGNAKGRLGVSRPVGSPTCFKINWKMLRYGAKVFVTVAKVQVNSNPAEESKGLNIKRLR